MKKNINRRQILGGLTATGALACSPQNSSSYNAQEKNYYGSFLHGVASGDPKSDKVIIWTRITPENPHLGQLNVKWELSENENFELISKSGFFSTQIARDFTVKIDVKNLEADREYYYRFHFNNNTSPVGKTKTLPEHSVEKVNFAIVSCSNWEHGYFNVYDHISRQEHYDAVIHLGDYYYEYGAGEYEGASETNLNRIHSPKHEIITLDDYRLRHAQYRSDNSLQLLTQKLPLIAIWDDHETSNDSWKSGADNHDLNEGSWTERTHAALRAYYEWMPVREPKLGQLKSDIFRSFDWGNLLTLITVETRLTARAEPLVMEDHFEKITSPGGADSFKSDILNDPSREMFGQNQSRFIIDELKKSKSSGTTWRVIANQVIMGRLLTADLEPYIDEGSLSIIEKDWKGVRKSIQLSKYKLPVYPDSWDGYPHAREQFYKELINEGIKDIIVLTGDAHEFWINDLTSKNNEKIGIECVTTSVSSKTMTAYLGENTSDYSLLLTQANPDARYYNALHNGYIDFSLSHENGKVKMMGVSTVKSQKYEAFEVASFELKRQSETIIATKPKGLNLKQRALFEGFGQSKS